MRLVDAAVRPWVGACRLNPAASWSRIPAEDTEARTLLERIGAHTQLAIENLRRLATDPPAGPEAHPRS